MEGKNATLLAYLLCKSINQYTEVRFASFLSGGFTTMSVINPQEKKLAKRISVQYGGLLCLLHEKLKVWFQKAKRACSFIRDFRVFVFHAISIYLSHIVVLQDSTVLNSQ